MEDRYLYECDYDKPELTEDFLEHYGILGMKWGIRKQPKYTGSLRQRIKKKKAYKVRVKSLKRARKIKAKLLAEAKKKAESEALKNRTKEEVMKAKDLKTMMKNIGDYSNAEIQSVMDRINKEKQFESYVKEQELAKMSKGKKLAKSVGSAIKTGIASGAKEGATNILKKVASNASEMAIDKMITKTLGSSHKDLADKLLGRHSELKVADLSKISKNIDKYSVSDLETLGRKINQKDAFDRHLNQKEHIKLSKINDIVRNPSNYTISDLNNMANMADTLDRLKKRKEK